MKRTDILFMLTFYVISGSRVGKIAGLLSMGSVYYCVFESPTDNFLYNFFGGKIMTIVFMLTDTLTLCINNYCDINQVGM